MYSFPNYVPLPAGEVQRMAAAISRWPFDRLYGPFPGPREHAPSSDLACTELGVRHMRVGSREGNGQIRRRAAACSAAGSRRASSCMRGGPACAWCLGQPRSPGTLQTMLPAAVGPDAAEKVQASAQRYCGVLEGASKQAFT